MNNNLKNESSDYNSGLSVFNFNNNYESIFHSIRKMIARGDLVTLRKTFRNLYQNDVNLFSKLINERRLITSNDIYEILIDFDSLDVKYIIENVLTINIKIELLKKCLIKMNSVNEKELKFVYELISFCGVEVLEEIKSVYNSDIRYRNKILSYLAKNNSLIKSSNSVNDVLIPITKMIKVAKSNLYEKYEVGLDFSGKLNGISVDVYVDNEDKYIDTYNNLNEFMINLFDRKIPVVLRNCLEGAVFHDDRNPADYYWSLKYDDKVITTDFYSAATAGDGIFTSWFLAEVDINTISHELGHLFDKNFCRFIGGKKKKYFTEEFEDWEEAISEDRNYVSDYGKNALCEDFAESVSMFVTDRKKFMMRHPNRANLLMKMLRYYVINDLGLNNIRRIDELIPIMLDYGISSEFIEMINEKKVPFAKVKKSFIEYVAYSKDMSESLFINMDSLDESYIDIVNIGNYRR